MKRLIIPCLAALALSACATAPTNFQPSTRPGGVGFSEMRIEPGRYRVIFQGGPGAPPAQVQDFARRHWTDGALRAVVVDNENGDRRGDIRFHATGT